MIKKQIGTMKSNCKMSQKEFGQNDIMQYTSAVIGFKIKSTNYIHVFHRNSQNFHLIAMLEDYNR